MGWWDEADEGRGSKTVVVAPSSSAPPLPPPRQDQPLALSDDDQQVHLQVIADKLFDKHAAILEAAADWPDMDGDDYPAEWVAEYGQVGAERRARIAKAANLPTKYAPVGLQLAKGVVSSMLKVQASKQSAPQLNVTIAHPTIHIGTSVEDWSHEAGATVVDVEDEESV